MQANRQNTIDAANGKWAGILSALGVDGKRLDKKHGPCPLCAGGVDRFRFIDKDGSGSYFCSHCGPGYGMGFVMKLLNLEFAEAAKIVDEKIGTVAVQHVREERSEAQKVQAIKRVLRECSTVVHGDPVWKYLNRRTGIELIPSDIKFHPALFHKDGGEHPAMIAVMRGPDGRGITLHRTYLTTQGEKANVDPVKMLMPGRALRGGAVRLSPIVECVGIAEGIETALAASLRFQVPVWAAMNATLLEQWIPPEGIKSVWIFGDCDTSFTGQSAAYALARRLSRTHAVDVSIPGEFDTDWADCVGK